MHPRITLSTANFFFAISSIASVYLLLPSLATFMSESAASLVIALGAAVSLAGFVALPRVVERHGAPPLAIALALAQMLALFALAARPGALLASAFIAALIALQPFLSYTLDLLLEATVSEEGTTGRVRTLFLTAYNVAAFGAPLLMGSLLNDTDAYARVFLAASVALVPLVMIFAARRLPAGRPATRTLLRDAVRGVLRDRDLAAVALAHLLLYAFYMWAPLYVPVYLHTLLHIPWSELGWMFAVMLLPFSIVEYPAGWLADNVLGDKELMVLGFIIMGSAFALVPLIGATTSVWVILAILVATRVGAALVEAMTEAHFFRRVSEVDDETIAVYRMLWPLADLIAPLIGSALLVIGGFSGLFATTGGILVVVGVAAALAIRDFR
jgi:MFS family permease